MKTRRILAASTAALLSFASVAVVASAQDGGSGGSTGGGSGPTTPASPTAYTDVALADGSDWPASFAATDTSASVKSAIEALTFTAKDENGDVASSFAADSEFEVVVTGSNKTAWTVKIQPVADATTFTAVTKTIPIAFAGTAKADLQGTAGSDVNLDDNITASIDKKVAKTFKGYEMSAKELNVTKDGTDEDATVDTENCDVIKGLKDELKEEFADIKGSDVALINVEVSNGTYVENSTPGKVTIKVVTSFKPAYVYHVVGDSVELVKMNGTPKTIVGGDSYETTFVTDKFSPFILTTAKLKNAGVAAETTDPEAVESTESGEGTTSPETGIALAIAPVVLAAGAVAVVALKKKH